MATLTVRNLDESRVRKLRIRAAEHGRSAEAEHREILRSVLEPMRPTLTREEAIARLGELREELKGRDFPSSVELLRESRRERMKQLTGSDEGMP
jgi:plasmid stability protein